MTTLQLIKDEICTRLEVQNITAAQLKNQFPHLVPSGANFRRKDTWQQVLDLIIGDSVIEGLLEPEGYDIEERYVEPTTLTRPNPPSCDILEHYEAQQQQLDYEVFKLKNQLWVTQMELEDKRQEIEYEELMQMTFEPVAKDLGLELLKEEAPAKDAPKLDEPMFDESEEFLLICVALFTTVTMFMFLGYMWSMILILCYVLKGELWSMLWDWVGKAGHSAKSLRLTLDGPEVAPTT